MVPDRPKMAQRRHNVAQARPKDGSRQAQDGSRQARDGSKRFQGGSTQALQGPTQRIPRQRSLGVSQTPGESRGAGGVCGSPGTVRVPWTIWESSGVSGAVWDSLGVQGSLGVPGNRRPTQWSVHGRDPGLSLQEVQGLLKGLIKLIKSPQHRPHVVL